MVSLRFSEERVDHFLWNFRDIRVGVLVDKDIMAAIFEGSKLEFAYFYQSPCYSKLCFDTCDPRLFFCPFKELKGQSNSKRICFLDLIISSLSPSRSLFFQSLNNFS